MYASDDARAPDSVRIVHAFAAFNLGQDASAWFEWVPSNANVADLPSRGDFELLRRLGSVERELKPGGGGWTLQLYIEGPCS